MSSDDAMALGRRRRSRSHGSVWTHANRVKRTGRVARTRRRSLWRPSWSLLEQATNRLAAVTASPRQFVDEFTVGPRRLTAGVPVAEHVQRLVVRQREAPDNATANAERVNIAVLSGDGGRNGGDVLPRSVNRIPGPSRDGHGDRRCKRWRLWKISRFEHLVFVAILDAHDVRGRAFVIYESRQPRHLRACRRGRVRSQLASEMLLEGFYRIAGEPSHAPEQ